MKSSLLKAYSLVLMLMVTLSSCRAIASIFKAGVWVGVVIVVAVILLILWLVGRARK